MNQRNVYLGSAIFFALMCFTFTFNSAEPQWLWKGVTLAPYVFGGISGIAFLLYWRKSRTSGAK